MSEIFEQQRVEKILRLKDVIKGKIAYYDKGLCAVAMTAARILNDAKPWNKKITNKIILPFTNNIISRISFLEHLDRKSGAKLKAVKELKKARNNLKVNIKKNDYNQVLKIIDSLHKINNNLLEELGEAKNAKK